MYVDAHPVKPDRVDLQRADEHKQWLADLKRQLCRTFLAHAVNAIAIEQRAFRMRKKRAAECVVLGGRRASR